jgi:small Trp-rich protein
MGWRPACGFARPALENVSMALVIIGVLLVLAHWAGIGPMADWPWWAFVLPFVGAVAWWAFSDATGVTQRRAMRKMDERKEERRQRAMEQLGLGTKRPPAGDPRTMSKSPDRKPAAPREPRL